MNKNHEKSIQTTPKSFPNRLKTTPKSMKMRPWIIFGAKSCPGGLLARWAKDWPKGVLEATGLDQVSYF